MTAENNRVKIDPDLGFVQEIIEDGGESLKKCFQCGTCSVVCNLAPEDSPFPRQEMIWAQWGMRDNLIGDGNVWLCHQCSDCTAYCPRGAKPGEVLGAVRKKVIESVSFPPALAKRMGDPHYLPWLFGIPALILLILVFANPYWPWVHGEMSDSQIVFGHMIDHWVINMVYVPLVGLAALVFLAGINRLWKGMSGESVPAFISGADKPRLGSAVVDVIKRIVTHDDFNQCETNKWRRLAHQLVFFSFIGLLVVTVLAIVVLVAYEIFGKDWFGVYPLVWYHPIKWLANASAAAFIIGSGIMIKKRRELKDSGDMTSSYFDYLFLYIIFGVGVTGFLAQMFRFWDVHLLAFPTYYVHLILVFSLLVYSPYSKFAHFLYRTVALIYLKYEELGKEKAKAPEASEKAEEAAA
ncbi:MAG: quinone-interacting membrane-bound oxidoreductase complex subunit QmoC [bacterium]